MKKLLFILCLYWSVASGASVTVLQLHNTNSLVVFVNLAYDVTRSDGTHETYSSFDYNNIAPGAVQNVNILDTSQSWSMSNIRCRTSAGAWVVQSPSSFSGTLQSGTRHLDLSIVAVPVPYTWAVQAQNTSVVTYRGECYLKRSDGGEWVRYSSGDFSVAAGGSHQASFSVPQESSGALTSVMYAIYFGHSSLWVGDGSTEKFFSPTDAGTFVFNWNEPQNSVLPPEVPKPPTEPTSNPLPQPWQTPTPPTPENPAQNVAIDPNVIAQGVSAGINQSGLRSDVQSLAEKIDGGSAAGPVSISPVEGDDPDTESMTDSAEDLLSDPEGKIGFIEDWLGSFFTLSLPDSVGAVPTLTIQFGSTICGVSSLTADLSRFPAIAGLRNFVAAIIYLCAVWGAVNIYKGTF